MHTRVLYRSYVRGASCEPLAESEQGHHPLGTVRDFDNPSEIGGIRVVQTTDNEDDLLNQNVLRNRMPLVFLVDHQCLLIPSINRRNLISVTVLEPVDASNDFALRLRGSQ